MSPNASPEPPLYSYASDRRNYVTRRTRALVSALSAPRPFNLTESVQAARRSAICQPAYELRARTLEAFRLWATSLDSVETSGFGVGWPSSPERLNTQQTNALALWSSAETEHQRRQAAEIGECGSYLWVALGPDGPCTLRNRCKHRPCPQCRAHRGFQIATAATELMRTWSHAKFLTLTRAPRDLSLEDTVKTLIHDFNRLRRTAIWRACLKEGIYTVEIKRNFERKWWHVHLHIIVQGKYIPQQEISRAWHHITGDSRNVWITKAVPSHAKYIAKYIAKGSENDLQPWEQHAYWNELKGCRLCGTFGGAPGIDALQPDPVHTLIAPLHVVQQWATEGDPWAQQLLAAIVSRMMAPEPTKAGP